MILHSSCANALVTMYFSWRRAIVLSDIGVAADILHPTATKSFWIPVQCSSMRALFVSADAGETVAASTHMNTRIPEPPTINHDLPLGMLFVSAHTPVP